MKKVSLSNFPEMFDPLIIVAGDRREERPKTQGDLLAYSVSSIDLSYITYLNLNDTPILSDKLFVLEDQSFLKKHFGKKNILTIGSPAVNLFSRKVNGEGLFYFDISEEAKNDIKKHEKLIDKIKFSPIDLFLYKEIFKNQLKPKKILTNKLINFPDKNKLKEKCQQLYKEFKSLNLTEENWKQLIHNFDRPGIIDLIEERKQAVVTRGANDFGFVSISYNPYSEKDYFVIMVAGIHGLATAHGVKLLSDSAAFKNRPYGGVFEVQFPEYMSWSRRLEKGTVKWQTQSYDPNDEKYKKLPLVLNLNNHSKTHSRKKFGFFISSPYSEESKYFNNLNKKLESICKISFSKTKTAYSIKTSGKGTFPKVINNRIEMSSAIIHILNNLKPGVLFEIGLSLGFRKPAYLIWDKKLEPFNQRKIPEIIEKINIIKFDTTKEKEFEKKIINNIIKPSTKLNRDLMCCQHAGSQCLISEIHTHKNERLFFYSSGRYNQYKQAIFHIASEDFGIHPIDDSELKGAGKLSSCCFGIKFSTKCIFLLDKKDNNGIILLGMAQALKKDTLLLRNEKLSMWDGEFKLISPSTEKKVIRKETRGFFKKYL